MDTLLEYFQAEDERVLDYQRTAPDILEENLFCCKWEKNKIENNVKAGCLFVSKDKSVVEFRMINETSIKN